jgi:hypothetical protein
MRKTICQDAEEYDPEFQEGVTLVRETGKLIVEVARDVGVEGARWATG